MTTTQPRTNTLRRRPWPHELAEACGADGLSMAQIMQRWRLSTWPAYQSVVDDGSVKCWADADGQRRAAADALEAQAARIAELEAALREAMTQAVEYDDLVVSNLGPQHWYSIARAALQEKQP